MANNPRSRDRVRQAASMTPAALLPTVPEVTDASDPQQVLQALQAIRNIINTRTGASNPFEAWLTGRWADEIGLNGRIQATAPADALAMLVWTNRQRFQLVNTAGITSLLGLTSSSTSEVTLAQYNALVSDVQALATRSTTKTQVDQLLANQRAELLKLASDALYAQEQKFNGLIEELRNQALAVIVDLNQKIQGAVLEVTPATTSWVLVHSFDRTPLVQFYDNSSPPVQITPTTIEATNATTITATFGVAKAGKAVLR